MFYKIIEKKRDEWLHSPECIVTDMLSYIKEQRKLRDAQVEAIKTYLFLKIACKNQPLWKLFASGRFNSTDIGELEIKQDTRIVLESNPTALALWEYASITDENGNMNSPKLVEAIKKTPNAINYTQIIQDLFFNVNYPDYLFSLPMGAGKTYLMAALMYLNLYFALSEPDSPLFAHNFMLLVPSGLKSSIIPSLRDIQNFDPLWILPDPIATRLKNMIHYEWLQETSSASKSNLVKNPNARKVSMHTAQPNLFGLVAITNAEKVILDRVDKKLDMDECLLKLLSEKEREEYEATKQANELRNEISKIPGLCILIDEVHHASDDQKLRQVVNKWMEQSNLNSVLGFSGTPNMDPAMRINITEGLSVKCTQYSNVVTYYPLIKGLGNFLKIPTVRYANLDSSEILEKGLREFFDQYADTVYSNGGIAKIAIYAPSISVLEEELYLEACRLCTELGLNPSETILKYHKGNSTYKITEDAQFEFNMLDSPLSKKRIILLVGIGREGWNCKSLAGVILSQRNACPQNMVLQISCRCLREVDNANKETALIWLNKFNADKLNSQLQEQQYTTIAEFGSKKPGDTATIHRYSRMDKLRVPPIDFYQIKINYHTVETERIPDIKAYLHTYQPPIMGSTIVYTQGFDSNNTSVESMKTLVAKQPINFRLWLDLIVKESLGTLAIQELGRYEEQLFEIFNKIVQANENNLMLRTDIDQERVRVDIRKCFVAKRTFRVTEELIPEEASLLKVDALRSPIEVSPKDIYSPSQKKVEEIIALDDFPNPTISAEELAMLQAMKARGFAVVIPETVDSMYDRTYHYLPYHFDSPLEDDYLTDVLCYLKSVPGIEFYFNGDDQLTDFKIRCYAKRGSVWKMLGYYYPDFILLTRNADDSICKIVIVETKGEGFAGKFEPRKRFMEEMFVTLNNERYGRERFAFLYIEDTDSKEMRLQKTIHKIQTFLLN